MSFLFCTECSTERYGFAIHSVPASLYHASSPDFPSVQGNKPLQMNQKVIIIPIESENDLGESAAGGLHKYTDVPLIEQEKDTMRDMAEIIFFHVSFTYI